jgi:O-antigen/teichoic acid export membrane protein
MAEAETPLAPDPDPAADGDRPADRRSLAVAAAGSTVWNLASQALQTLLGFGTTVLLTKWLRPEDYGVFGMASTMVLFFGIFGDGGLTTALIRRPKVDPTTETTAFAMTLLGGLVLAVLTGLAAPGIGVYFKSREVGIMAAVLSANFLVLAPGRVSFAKLTRKLRFQTLSVIGIATSAISSGLSLLAASRGFGGWSLAASFLAAPVVMTCLYLIVAPPKLVPRLFSRALARELSAFGAHLSGFTIAVCIAWLPWTMLLGRVSDSAAVGLFGMGTRLVVFSTDRIGSAFAAVFLPSVAKMPFEERRHAYLKTLRTLAMCTMPVAIGFVSIADEFVTVLSVRWSGLAPVIKGLAVGASVGPLAMFSTTLLTADGRSRTVFRLGLLVIPLVWTGSALAALVGGLSSFVFAWSALTIISTVVFLSMPAVNLGGAISILRSVERPMLAAGLMGAGVEALQQVTGTAGHRIGLPLGIVAGAILYLGIGRLLMKDDMLRALRLLRSALHRSDR